VSQDAAEAEPMPAAPAADMAYAPPPAEPPMTPEARDRFRQMAENGFKDPRADPLSTFSIDVDTASYSLVRRFLNEGRLPPTASVRVEEMLNYFDYAYEGPKNGAHPFAVHTAVTEAPWDSGNRLVRVGIKGLEVPIEEAPSANLVFLIDVSGSMEGPDRLELLKKSFVPFVEKLRRQDSVGIVVYAGASGVVLRPTNDKEAILDALDALHAGGSTNGGAGIEAAYGLAKDAFKQGGINRVILATDGDFNVGVTSDGALVALVEKKAKDGIFLSVLGFGIGNYNDAMMEQIADRGNGNYAYVDSLEEAHKILVRQMSGTIITIAKDVKIQVEFNPAKVESYRLIGYENRALAAEDFNDDKKDAGDVGAGHTVTALYEVVPKGKRTVDALRYQTNGKTQRTQRDDGDELLTVKVRYKQPEGTKSQLLTKHVSERVTPLADAGADFRFAAAVAGFGLKLRGSKEGQTLNYREIIDLAKSGLGDDQDGVRAELLGLVRKAERLTVHH